MPDIMEEKEAFTTDTNNKLTKRDKWSNPIQFLFGCCGFSVGLGNVWRFPYLCYRDGGGAFLIPYFIAVFLGAIPIFILEIALGQYTSQGAITAWNLTPILKGVGYASQVAIFYTNIYYQVILAWILHYLFASLTTTLPWTHCNNEWNTPNCGDRFYTNTSRHLNTSGYDSSTASYATNTSDPLKAVDPVTEYWQNRVLGISSGVDDIGNIKWDLALCLLLAWVIVYFCLWKGIKWTGKIVYVTVSLPYIFMAILLVRGATLPGAIIGIKHYLIPDFNRLMNTQVWVGAATQVFFSYSMGAGSLIALGSFNKFHHNFWRDCWIFALINSGTSLLAGFVIFSVLGYMAHEHQVSIDLVAESGPGLAFIVYPKAVSKLPAAPLWSIIFFVMLLLLGMDTQFGCVEGFITALTDCFPQYLRRPKAREIMVAVVCAVSFLAGLIMVTNGGMYVFQLFDYYSSARAVIVFALFEVIAIGWVYGAKQFKANIELMLGRSIPQFWVYAWRFITPTFVLISVVMTFYHYSAVTYNRTYIYPQWAVGIGWFLSFSSIGMIPFIAVYRMLTAKGSCKERYDEVSCPDLAARCQHPSEEMKMTGCEDTEA